MKTSPMAGFFLVFVFSYGTMSGVHANPTLINLPADSWYQVPNSKMRPKCYPAQYGDGIFGVSGCVCVMERWSGGAYDPGRNQLLIWGGGHNGYHGNELYAFKLASLGWERLTEPTPGSYPRNRDPLGDGNPASRHTYSGLDFIVHADRFFGQGGSRADDGGETRLTWTFDANTKQWTNRQPTGSAYPGAGHAYNLSCAYDPVSKKIYMRDPYNLYAYDYDANSWTGLKSWAHTWNEQSATVDPSRRLYFTLGTGEFQVWNIDQKQDVTSQWSTTGGSAIISALAPGLAYDPRADALVAWAGGGPYVLDLSSKTWTRKSSANVPASQISFGTYGRFRYAPEYNVFVLANGVDQDVYIYKHTAGGPVSTSFDLPPQASKSLDLTLEVFPNPIQSVATIRSTGLVSIYDLTGRRLSILSQTEKHIGPREFHWQPDGLPMGFYIVKAEKKDSKLTRRVLVIR